jgi:hypothetical protein
MKIAIRLRGGRPLRGADRLRGGRQGALLPCTLLFHLRWIQFACRAGSHFAAQIACAASG